MGSPFSTPKAKLRVRIIFSASFFLFSGCARNYSSPDFHSLENIPVGLVISKAPAIASEPIRRWKEKIDFRDLRFRASGDQTVTPDIDGSVPYLVERFPVVPQISRRIGLKSGEAATFTLESLELEGSDLPVPLALAPETIVWSDDGQTSRSPQDSSGNRDAYFPGELLRGLRVDSELILNFFPVQRERATGRLVTLKTAVLVLEIFGSPIKMLPAASPSAIDGLILTSRSLAPGAKLLSRLHRRIYRQESEIVYAEDVARDEAPLDENDLPPGYKDIGPVEPIPNGFPSRRYRYYLARQIARYLRRRVSENANLKFVTLLGDASQIPPSYYFSVAPGFGPTVTVPDQCYSAKQSCLDPYVALGRLPFSNVDEIRKYVVKMLSWVRRSPQLTSELSLFGGRAFPGEILLAELGTLRVISTPDADWNRVQKFHRSSENYSVRELTASLRAEHPSLFLYSLDHGRGNQWSVDREFLTSNQITSLVPANSGALPIVVAAACSNANFDASLFDIPAFARPEFGTESVGVSLLKSRAGAVAYLDATRPTIGAPIFEIDRRGNLELTSSTYSLQLAEAFFENYRKRRGGTLGETVLRAQRAYLFEHGNDLSLPQHRWTFWSTALLGDPAMRLPFRTAFDVKHPVAFSTHEFEKGPGMFPLAFFERNEAFLMTAKTATSVWATLLKVIRTTAGFEERVVEPKRVFSAQAAPIEQTVRDDAIQERGRFLWKLENAIGVPVERHVWWLGQPK